MRHDPRRRRERAMRVLTLACLLALGCEGAERPEGAATGEAGIADTAAVVDTQYVVDSLGDSLQLIINRRPLVREVHAEAGKGDPDEPGVIRSLKPKVAHERMRSAQPKWYVIDLRDSRAWASGHVPESGLIPLELLEENIGDLHVRTDQTVLVYDDDPRDAMAGARLLASYGLPRVRILEGGLDAWEEAGLPVESHR